MEVKHLHSTAPHVLSPGLSECGSRLCFLALDRSFYFTVCFSFSFVKPAFSDNYKIVFFHADFSSSLYFYQQNSALPLGRRYFPSLLVFLSVQPPSHHWATQFFPVMGPEDDWPLRTLQGAAWVLGGREGSGEGSGSPSTGHLHKVHLLTVRPWGRARAQKDRGEKISVQLTHKCR